MTAWRPTWTTSSSWRRKCMRNTTYNRTITSKDAYQLKEDELLMSGPFSGNRSNYNGTKSNKVVILKRGSELTSFQRLSQAYIDGNPPKRPKTEQPRDQTGRSLRSVEQLEREFLLQSDSPPLKKIPSESLAFEDGTPARLPHIRPGGQPPRGLNENALEFPLRTPVRLPPTSQREGQTPRGQIENALEFPLRTPVRLAPTSQREGQTPRGQIENALEFSLRTPARLAPTSQREGQTPRGQIEEERSIRSADGPSTSAQVDAEAEAAPNEPLGATHRPENEAEASATRVRIATKAVESNVNAAMSKIRAAHGVVVKHVPTGKDLATAVKNNAISDDLLSSLADLPQAQIKMLLGKVSLSKLEDVLEARPPPLDPALRQSLIWLSNAVTKMRLESSERINKHDFSKGLTLTHIKNLKRDEFMITMNDVVYVDAIEVMLKTYERTGKRNETMFLRKYLKTVIYHLVPVPEFHLMYVYRIQKQGGFLLPEGVTECLCAISQRLHDLHLVDDAPDFTDRETRRIRHDKIFREIMSGAVTTMRRGRTQGVTWLGRCAMDSSGVFINEILKFEYPAARDSNTIPEDQNNNHDQLDEDPPGRHVVAINYDDLD